MNAVVVLCAAFSLHSRPSCTIEQVRIVQNGRVGVVPTFDESEFVVDTDYRRGICGLPALSDRAIVGLLARMQLRAEPVDGKLRVIVPPTRSDILHPCDIAEELAVSYGYDNLAREITHPIQAGCLLGINELTDRIRREVVASLWIEILSFSLCSARECYELLNLPDDRRSVKIKNTRSADFEIVRTTLLGGLLKATNRILAPRNLRRAEVLPLKIFEISDVVLLDASSDTGAKNQRRFCATIADVRARFEELHGLLDRFFLLLGYPRGYHLAGEDVPSANSDGRAICIPGQRARIEWNGKVIGWIGVIDPSVLNNFEVSLPVVAFELEIEPFVIK
jgi:phenylalanyl-tRNA synthetase beta chain